MQCIIMAAGEGVRMRPLTLDRPKPLVHLCGVPILEHILRSLPATGIDEIIIVIGYKGDMIRTYLGDEIQGRKIRYVFQDQPKGTANALRMADPYIRDKFLILNGDDLLDGKTLACAIDNDLSIFVFEHTEPSRFGVVLTHQDGTLSEILEKPQNPPSHLVSTGAMVLDRRVFDFIGPPPENGEQYLSHIVSELAREYHVNVVPMEFWCPVGRPEDIPIAESILLAQSMSSPSTVFLS